MLWYRIERFIVIDGYVHFRLYEPRCHVCRSPYRDHIETMVRLNLLAFGPGSTRGIVEHLPEDAGISWRSIRRHVFRGHDPILGILRQAARSQRRPADDHLPPTILGDKWSHGTGSDTSGIFDQLRHQVREAKAKVSLQ